MRASSRRPDETRLIKACPEDRATLGSDPSAEAGGYTAQSGAAFTLGGRPVCFISLAGTR